MKVYSINKKVTTVNDSKTKKQIVDKIKDSNNVLVALSASPSVDELSAALGITLAINKIDKHATAVFSGDIPAAIEFLEPEKTFENSVASLQDFIIALDKEKADHLRYKVEGDMVKIFITPYRTTIDERDLEFSQGDYNVDFVLAIGVKNKDDLDAALRSHGQILDDATVASIALDDTANMGTINWADKNASSYCELATSLIKDLKDGESLLDEQIATALLTGIVASTDRFSNERTSSRVMTTAAELMSAGANQQLIAVKLQDADAISIDQPAAKGESADIPSVPTKPEEAESKGGLSISHELKGNVDEVADQVKEISQKEAAKAAEDELAEKLGVAQPAYEETPLKGAVGLESWKLPPAEPELGGTLNATTEQAAEDKRREEESDQNRTILSHDVDGYMTQAPTYQAPMSAATTAPAEEPEVVDIFAQNPTVAVPDQSVSTLPPEQPLAQGATFDDSMSTLPPSMQAASGPTLADIDAANRGTAPEAPGAQLPPLNPGALPMPPLPPMPTDLSTLPPLPTAAPVSPFGADQAALPGAPLGSTLPPAPEPGKADPSQFKIPGQP